MLDISGSESNAKEAADCLLIGLTFNTLSTFSDPFVKMKYSKKNKLHI